MYGHQRDENTPVGMLDLADGLTHEEEPVPWPGHRIDMERISVAWPDLVFTVEVETAKRSSSE